MRINHVGLLVSLTPKESSHLKAQQQRWESEREELRKKDPALVGRMDRRRAAWRLERDKREAL